MLRVFDIFMKRGDRIEVPRPTRSGRPAYAWVQGWTVIDKRMGTLSQSLRYREAQALLKEMRSKDAEVVQFHRLPSDGNGNPRYVCDYSWFLTDSELQDMQLGRFEKYEIAVKRSHDIGGSRYDFKRFRSGIVQQSYSLKETIGHMARITGRRYVDFDR